MKIRRRKFGGRLMNTIKTPTDDGAPPNASAVTAVLTLCLLLASAVGVAAQKTPARAKEAQSTDESQIYSWYDFDQERQIVLVGPDTIVMEDVPNLMRQSVSEAVEAGHPIFRQGSESGPIMLLPGGVMIDLKPHVVAERFFRQQELWDFAEKLGFGNLWRVRTEPGWVSLELANSLVDEDVVETAQPDWLREVTQR